MTIGAPGARRLYLADPWLRQFESVVVEQGSVGSRPSVVLRETAFYAEAGGQLADRGWLAESEVVDVQLDRAGRIHHLLDGQRPDVGAVVVGRLDWPRRREHMALHTGQHMLSQALLVVAGARTVSSRLGETDCTIDVDRPGLGSDEIVRAEELVHRVIDDDAPIRAWVPEASELATLPLRRSPKVTDDVRVVQIGEFDFTPCGGTHCTSAGQVGLVRVLGTERYKGKVRVHFAAGGRARRLLAAESALLRELGREHSCAPLDVPAAVRKLQHELGDARARLGQAHTRLGVLLGAELLARAADPGRIVATFDDAPIELLRAVAARITAEPRAVAMLAGPSPAGQLVVVSRGRDADVHCGRLLGRAAALVGGRGGGRADHAEGLLPAAAHWKDAIDRALGER